MRRCLGIGHLYLSNIKSYLVGGFYHLEKYESQWEGLYIMDIMENKKKKQTTNQEVLIIDLVEGKSSRKHENIHEFCPN